MLYLLCLALFIIPLCGPITIIPFIDVKDLWKAKEFLVILTIAASCYFPLKSYRTSKPLQWILIFLIISTFLMPPIVLKLGNADLGGLWAWKSLAWVLGYFILYQRIASMSLHINDKELISKAIGYAALISSIYAIVQLLNTDQFQLVRDWHDIGMGNSHPEMTGMIGNSVYLSIFLVMSLPFSLYAMRPWQSWTIVTAVLLAGSDTATCGMIIILSILWAMKVKSDLWLKLLLAMTVISATVCVSYWPQIRPHIRDNSRFQIWKEVVKDWHGPVLTQEVTPDMSESQKSAYAILNKRTWSLTGRGLGSFEFLFQRKFPGWNDPHNVYLKILYELGLIGVCLFLWNIGSILWRNFALARKDEWTLVLYLALVFCCFSALTTPLLIIEPLRLLICVIFALLSCGGVNKKLRGGHIS